jgi:hypothetical protein
MVVGLYKEGRAAITQRDASGTVLIAWVLCVLVPFSLAEVKYIRYILCVFPALAILSASALNAWIPLKKKVQTFKVLYALGAAVLVYAAFFPKFLLRATEMRQLAPVADAHSRPEESLLIYSSGSQDWGVQNQLLWYGNRHTELITDLAAVKTRLQSGRSTVVVIDRESEERLRATLVDQKAGTLTVLAQTPKFSCLKYSAPPA